VGLSVSLRATSLFRSFTRSAEALDSNPSVWVQVGGEADLAVGDEVTEPTHVSADQPLRPRSDRKPSTGTSMSARPLMHLAPAPSPQAIGGTSADLTAPLDETEEAGPGRQVGFSVQI
jgi:hypothetical protein